MRNKLKLKPIEVAVGDLRYKSYRVSGTVNGRRVRFQSTDRAEALAELNRLQVEAANCATVQARPTRLSAEQVAEAEAAYRRLGPAKNLTAAVEWYLTTYREPAVAMTIPEADTAFRASKEGHVSPLVLRDYKRVLRDLAEAFPNRLVNDLCRADIQTHLEKMKLGPKAWNNTRGMLNAFFRFCSDDDRRWAQGNPVTKLAKFKISRGIPAIETAEKIKEVFTFLETYAGEKFTKAKPGFLVPYFALCTFAGLRPSCPGGEAWKLGGVEDLTRIIDLKLGVIRIGPEIAKTRDLRQVTIQPALRAWLERYPIKDYPIRGKDMQRLVSLVRKKFSLSADVLRHTFISMHVGKFQSIGGTAIESGNSERIIKRHYLNSVTLAEAELFWGIVPSA
jgi:hypothetical protein